MAAVLLAGCGPLAAAPTTGTAAAQPAQTPTPEPSARDLTFSYKGFPPKDNHIDQVLDITNSFDRSVVPVLAFTALDANGRVLPTVKVTTVFGSDRGNLVVPYGSAGMDILRFSGTGEHQVANVRVTVSSITLARTQAGNYDPAQALNAHGSPVSKFSEFTAVSVSNPDSYPVSVRLVYLVYDQPPANQTQQVVVVVPIGDLIALPAHGKAIVQVTGAAARAVAKYSNGPAVSIKTYGSQ